VSFQLSAVSYQLSGISCQVSAVSYQPSAISDNGYTVVTDTDVVSNASRKQVPRGLKSTRDDKKEVELIGTTLVVP